MKPNNVTQKRLASALRRALTLGGCAGLSLVSTVLFAQSVPAAPSQVQSGEATNTTERVEKPHTAKTQPAQLEAITVTGTIGSLMRQTVTKQDNIAIVDSISAQEAGSFPDRTVAGALQRIPGVSVNREADGEPNQISIRGLGPQFVNVLLNGHPVASSTFDRAFNLDTIPVQLLQQAVVYKTAQPNLPAGGIGGTVNVITWQPLEFTGFHANVRVAAQRESLSGANTQNTKPRVSTMIGYTTKDRKYGWLLAAGFEQRAEQYTSVDAEGGWRQANLTATDPPKVAALTEGIESNYTFQSRTRRSVDLALEAQPISRLDVNANFLATEYTGSDQTYTNDYFTAFNQIVSAETDKNNTVTSFTTNTVPGVQDVFEPTLAPTNEKIRSAFVHVRYRLGDGNTISLSSTASQGTNKGLDTYRGIAGYLTNVESPLVFHNPATLGMAFPYYTGGLGSVDITNLRTHDTQLTSSSLSDHVLSNSIVFRHEFEDGFISDVEGGVTSTAETHRTIDFEWPDNGFFYHQFFGHFNAIVPPSAADAHIVTFNNIGGKYGKYQPKSFVTFDPAQLIQFFQTQAAYNQLAPAERSEYLAALAGYPDGVPLLPTPGSLSRVREIDNAAYGLADFADSFLGRPWSMQVGLRYVRTTVASSGIGQPLEALDFDFADFDSAVQVYGPTQPLMKNSKYSFWLPSLNFKYNLSQNVLFRAAYSKTLSRPELDQLGVAQTFGVEGQLSESTGNPDLKPYLSKNYDLGVGWFFGPVSYLSFDVFEKKVSNFVTTITEAVPAASVVPSVSPDLNPALVDPGIFVTKPVNLNAATVKGYEATANDRFDWLPGWLSGFGVEANYAHVISNASLGAAEVASGTVFAIPGMGNSYNLSLYYDKYGIDGRIAYNYRAGYLVSIAGPGGLPVSANHFGELDFKLGYTFTPHLRGFVEADNLTNASVFEYSLFTTRPILGSEFGRSYEIGMAWKL